MQNTYIQQQQKPQNQNIKIGSTTGFTTPMVKILAKGCAMLITLEIAVCQLKTMFHFVCVVCLVID